MRGARSLTRNRFVLCEMRDEDEETVEHRACGRMSRFIWSKNKAPSDETVRDKRRECYASASHDKHRRCYAPDTTDSNYAVKWPAAEVMCPSLLQTSNNFSSGYYSTSTDVLQFAVRNSAVHKHQAK